MNEKQQHDGHFYLGALSGILFGMIFTWSVMTVFHNSGWTATLLILSFVLMRASLRANLKGKGVDLGIVSEQRKNYRESVEKEVKSE